MRENKRNSIEDRRRETCQCFISALLSVLKGTQSSSRVKCASARSLARIGANTSGSNFNQDRETIIILSSLLMDSDPNVRMEAAGALGELKVAEATEALLKNLEGDPDGDVRVQAVTALAEIGSKAAVEPLITCIREDGYPELDLIVDDFEYRTCWEIQRLALGALGTICDRQATTAVIEFLQNEDYEDLQEIGYQVLARLDGDAARQFLLCQLKEGNSRTRRRAAQAIADLAELGGNTKEELQLDVLGPLSDALLDENTGVRVAAAHALGATNNRSVLTSLTKLLSDPDADVRCEAATILSSKKDQVKIIDRLHDMLEEQDQDVKRHVVRILGKIGDPASADFIAPLLNGTSEQLLYEVLRTLGQIGEPGTEMQLAKILADQSRHPMVRVQAALALGSILMNIPRLDDDIQGSAEGEQITKSQEITGAKLSPDDVLLSTLSDQDERVAFAALSALVSANPGIAPRILTDLLRDGVVLQSQEKDAENVVQEAEVLRRETGRESPSGLTAEFPLGQDPKTSTLASILASQNYEVQQLQETPNSDRQNYDQHVNNETVEFEVSDEVRLQAAKLLGGMAAPDYRVVETLIEVAGEGDSNVCLEAIIALGRIGDERAVPVVVKSLESNRSEIRVAALNALGTSFSEHITADRIIELLDDPDPVIREQTVKTLATSGTIDTEDYISKALKDPDLSVCRSALNAMSSEICNPKIQTLVMETAFRFEGNLRREAGEALRLSSDCSFVIPYLELLEDPDLEDRHWILIDLLTEVYANKLPADDFERGFVA